ncbi:unnamed protein product, partial [Brassica rapa subsp. trilocularis]
NLEDLKVGKQVEVPIYEFDFKSRSRVGYRTLDVPASRIVIRDVCLSEKLRPLLDLRSRKDVSVDQIKAVLSEGHT